MFAMDFRPAVFWVRCRECQHVESFAERPESCVTPLIPHKPTLEPVTAFDTRAIVLRVRRSSSLEDDTFGGARARRRIEKQD